MNFISSFSNIAKQFKVYSDKPVIDDKIFQCHYKLTTNILLIFCILLTSINIIGHPIECITNLSKKTDVQKVLNTYCWISSSFTYQNNLNYRKHNIDEKEEKIRFHSYYQWVPFMLFFQAITFYVPHWIWKMWEGGKIKMITKDLREFSLSTTKDRHMKQNKLVQYFIESFHTHSTYVFGYILCETINMVNISANIYITNKFLGEFFLTYGIEVFKYHNNQSYQYNPMEIIFPRLANCNFFKYGPSGSIQYIDAMCILSQNNLNEKIYLFLWIWFFILAIISMWALVYRLIIITQIIKKKALLFDMFKFTKNKQIISTFFTKFQVGDYILLHFMEKNLHFTQFTEIIEEIYSNLNMKNHKEQYVSSQNVNSKFKV